MKYSDTFKAKMVSKMVGPGARSANSISREVGVSQAALSSWLRQAKMGSMVEKKQGKPPRAPSAAPKRWTAAEKIRVVMAAEAAGEAGLGELLRREGLHEATLAQFREEVLAAAARGLEASKPTKGLTPDQKKLREVERELARKEKALAETAALLVLRGKAEALFRSADEGGDTNENND